MGKESIQDDRQAERNANQARRLEVGQERIQDGRQARTEEDKEIRLMINRLRTSSNRNVFIPLLVYLREKKHTDTL